MGRTTQRYRRWDATSCKGACWTGLTAVRPLRTIVALSSFGSAPLRMVIGYDVCGSVNLDRSVMKAAIYRRYGPPNVVHIADVPRPDLKTTEVLVRVRATTVTAGDSRLRSGHVPRGFAVLLRLGFG